MSNAELIARLQQFPHDAEAKITWEGTIHEIEPDNVYLSADGKLILDADHNYYKDNLVATGRTYH